MQMSENVIYGNLKKFKGENVLIDTNVLLKIHYTMGSYNEDIVALYTAKLYEIINSECKIVLCPVLISEFINSFLRLEHMRIYRDVKVDSSHFKKVFRKTDDYEKVKSESVAVITKLLPYAVFHDVSNEFCSKYDSGLSYLDYNDLYYLESAKLNSFSILTDDADFAMKDLVSLDYKNIQIITYNKKAIV